MSFRILYQDDELVAIDKPAGFHVHPPEDRHHRVSPAVNCLAVLKKQLGVYLYPVHRLDRATSGVLLFALRSESANTLCEYFKNHEIKKVYHCVVRGWTEPAGRITSRLKVDGAPAQTQDAETYFLRLGTVELPEKVGKFDSTRYSFLKVEPKTGRRHQIRRHLNHISHPLIGDTIYGRGEHNRFFREKLGMHALLLKAYSLEFPHPGSGQPLRIVSRWGGTWHQVFDLFGLCPFEKGIP